MIVSSQAQNDASKVAKSTAQPAANAAQMDSSAFNLLLAILNQSDSGAGAGTFGLAAVLGEDPGGSPVGDDLTDEQAAIAAKIADWLAANPASLAALSGLAGSSLAIDFGSIASLGEMTGNTQSAELQALLARLAQDGLNGSQGGSGQDAASRGLEFLASIQAAGDGQSLAAALMAAIGTAQVGAVGATGQGGASNLLSSNRLLANSMYGTLTLADALSQGASNSGFGDLGGVGSGQAFALGGAGNSLVSMATGAFADTSGMRSGSGVDADLSQSSGFNGSLEKALYAAVMAAETRKSEQTTAGDVLLSAPAPGNAATNGLQQAMTAQAFGRSAIANANALAASVSWLASQQGGVATIDLTPPELGSLRLELKLDAAGESASLVVHAANDAAKAAIEQSLDRLYESFQASGIALSVSVGGGSTGFAQYFANGLSTGVVPPVGNNVRVDVSEEASSVQKESGVNSTDALSLYA